MAGVIKCHTGYKIGWKIDDFKFLHKSVQDYKTPQILESGHFTMWDWKFKLTLEQRYFNDDFISLNISLEVLDVKSWNEKGMSISAVVNSIYRTRDGPEKKEYSSTDRIKNYKFEYLHAFNFHRNRISGQNRHNFEITWKIWQDVASVGFKRHLSNVNRIQMMANKLGLMLDDTTDHDVKIQCGGVEMTAHKVILSGMSSVFKAMFQAGMKETRESVVEVTVGSPEAVKVMLRWIYGSTGDIEESHALDLLKLAHYYDLEGLMEECQLILVNKLCKENVIEKESHALDLLKLADYYNLEGLMEECQKLLMDSLCNENVIEILNEVDLLGAKELKDAAIQFIIRNKSDLKEDLKRKLNQNLGLELFLAQ